MNQTGVLHWVKIVFFFVGTVGIMNNLNAEEKIKTNYIVSFNTNDALCFVKINDMLVMDNVGMTENSFTSGKTISSYLQNGNNTLSITMLNDSLKGDHKVTSNMWCSAIVTEVNEKSPVSGVKLIVEDGKISVDPHFNPRKISYFGDSPRADDEEKGMIEVTQSFYATNLPDWAWTNARPMTEKDIPAIKEFYVSLQNDFKNQNLNTIYQKTEGMWHSLAIEQGSTPQKMWESMPFKRFFNDGYKAIPIDWEVYKLNSYMNGRIFRFETEYDRISPLIIENDDEDIFSLTPYLSIIDGKVTVVK
ncbi:MULTISPECIES: hypothetical protein [Providencia]|uniref:hypothetical protein n=1 Tax=Providencia TaxID=586 RepID=UPI001BD2C39F|nr:hypothetical protein [Providencia rettgeri]ELR5069647.1 hypothetical protein [Providencia rettgeri]ELR5220422.1 hypothetical protein [Providencia rettgeri]MDX7320789.1 hypothetical protein [Providencia rettgeri]